MQIKYPVEDYIRFLASQRKTDMVGVVIGVLYGVVVEDLFEYTNIKKIYLVDPYEYYTGYTIIHGSDMDKVYRETKELFEERYGDKVEFIRLKSEDAHTLIPDNRDFVHIDANPHYTYISRDIKLYWPKICKGGILGGKGYKYKYSGITAAVEEFAFANKLKLYWTEYIKDGHGMYNHNWWYKKDENK